MTDDFDATNLRRCLRDVVALSTLPALWVEATASQVATSVADALRSMLRLELVYVRIEGHAAGTPHEVGQAAGVSITENLGATLGEALAPWLTGGEPLEPTWIPHPLGSGSLRLAVMPMGAAWAPGRIAVAAARPDFPTDTERMLLQVAANQAAIAIRSAQRFAEQQRAERELRDFVDNATVGLHWVGPDGTILWANQAELDLMGYERDEYIGRHIAEFHADQEVIGDILHRLSCNESLRNYEARLRCKDGSIRYVLIDSNVRWEDGAFVHTRCFTRDITGRKLAEARYQTLFEHAADAILIADPTGRCVDANPAALALLGYERQDLLETHTSSLIARTTSGADAAPAHTASPDIWSGELELQRADGSVVPVEAHSAAVELPDGPMIFSIIRDVTERRAVERLQHEFLALVTHELKGPLTSLKGFAQLMQRRANYNPQGIAVILDRAEHLERLISDLLDATQLSAGRLGLTLRTTDLMEIVLTCADEAQTSTNRHLIDVASPDEPLVGRWDRVRLGQVFRNLLSNAIKYSPNGGPIIVTITNREDEVYISVSDQGIGIPAEAQALIFDRFFRGEASRHGTPGLGLGLYITRMLVEAHGGRIGVRSDEEQGSTFWFTLPYDAPTHDEQPADAASDQTRGTPA